MRVANDWKDYKIIATGDGEKLESWNGIILLRPDPQVIWHSKIRLNKYKALNAWYHRSETGGGAWQFLKDTPDEWEVSYKNLKFSLKTMGFKHTGLFPEQAYNWDKMIDLIKNSNREKIGRAHV